jgi:hypothetical protein
VQRLDHDAMPALSPTGNGWPPKPSVLVFGLELQAAGSMGQRFEQNALLWCGGDGVPRLVVLC